MCSFLITLLDACTALAGIPWETFDSGEVCSHSLQATKKVVLLAQRMEQLRGFVHVSSAYVNSNLPRGSHVEEKIYPIHRKNGQVLNHNETARTLAALSPASAEAKVQHNLC